MLGKILASMAIVTGLFLSAPAVAAPPPSDDTIDHAYVYLLGRALAIRQEQADIAAKGFQYNAITYNPLGSADFVNPNFDVAYLEAWIAVDDQSAVLLEVPQVSGRYYVAQILDEWGEVIANINERTFPSRPHGTFALVSPGSKATLPADAGRIVLHGNKAKLLGRVELKGDPDGAVALQRAFKLTPIGSPKIAKPVPLPDFDNEALMDSTIFDHADAIIASALDVSPVAAELQQQARSVAAHLAAQPGDRKRIDALIRSRVVPAFQRFALTEVAPYQDNWLVANIGGNYGANYPARTAVNLIGIWANVPSEVVYFVASKDANGQTLDGSNSYRMVFPKDKLPQSVVNGYWSVILVGVPDYRVVPNPIDRFNLNTYSPLTYAADGSLTLAIGPESPGDVDDANWLPTAKGKPFSLTFRSYVPQQDVIDGRWVPPALQPVK